MQHRRLKHETASLSTWLHHIIHIDSTSPAIVLQATTNYYLRCHCNDRKVPVPCNVGSDFYVIQNLSNQWLHSPSMPGVAAADYVSTPDTPLSLGHEWVIIFHQSWICLQIGAGICTVPQQTVAAGKVSCYNVIVCDSAHFHSLRR